MYNFKVLKSSAKAITVFDEDQTHWNQIFNIKYKDFTEPNIDIEESIMVLRYNINETVNRDMFNELDKGQLHKAFKYFAYNHILDPNDSQTVFTKIDPEIAGKLVTSQRPLRTFKSRIGTGFKGFITQNYYGDVCYFEVYDDGSVNVVNFKHDTDRYYQKLSDIVSRFNDVLYGITDSPEATGKLEQLLRTRHERKQHKETPNLQQRLRKYKIDKNAKIFIKLGVDFFEEIKNNINTKSIFGLCEHLDLLSDFYRIIYNCSRNQASYTSHYANMLFNHSERLYSYMNIIGGLTLDDLINIQNNKYTCYVEVEEDDVINESKSDPKLKFLLKKFNVYNKLYKHEIEPNSCKFKLVDFKTINNYNKSKNTKPLEKLLNTYDMLIICREQAYSNRVDALVIQNSYDFHFTGNILEIIGINVIESNLKNKKEARLQKKFEKIGTYIDLIIEEFDKMINVVKTNFGGDISIHIRKIFNIYDRYIKILKPLALRDDSEE